MLTDIFLKIFARSFYRLHAGLFLFIFFILFGIIEPSQWYSYHKNLMLGFLSRPLFLGIVFAAWLIYIIKSFHHTITLLFSTPQQFLFYSTTSFTRKAQFKSWFWVQLVIMLPVVLYGLLSSFAGFYYRYVVPSCCILLYLILLISSAAYLCLYFTNRLIKNGGRPFLLKITERWRKPLFSLYMYYIFDQLKVSLLITKICSWLMIIAVFYLFARESADLRVPAICMLLISLTHAVLIYQQRRFGNTYLSFVRNMPYRRDIFFLKLTLSYLIILLPEGVWIFTRFTPLSALPLYLLVLSIVILFHVLLYVSKANMVKYLRRIFTLFIVLFFLTMFGLLWSLIVVNLAAAFMIFYRYYYRAH